MAAIDDAVTLHMRAEGTPGVAIALTDRERLLHSAAYGFADRSARFPVTGATRFEIGSIGKSFTSVALLQLHETGRLDLHAPLERYLPWFRVGTEYTPITIHHLLSHTAGIVTGTDFTPEAAYQVWALRDTQTGCPPGTHFHYSNVGYKALGLVLADLRGQSFETAIQSAILDPLGMRDTVPAITHGARSDLAVGYEPADDDCVVNPGLLLAPAPWIETNTADGSIASTAADMAVYVRMLLNRGLGPQERILSEESFALMTQCVIAMPDGGFYGYGLMSDTIAGHHYIRHDGSMIGYRSTLWADLDAGLGVTVLMNGPGDPDALAAFSLQALRAARNARELPAPPLAADPTWIENAAEFAGLYRAGDQTLELIADRQRLLLRHDEEPLVLERRGHAGDCFVVSHRAFAHFFLRFGRDADGRVVEAFHGPTWYRNDRYGGPLSFDHPPEWEAYPGHYRSHNPWLSNFRVVLRKGELLICFPTNPQGFAVERVLKPRGPGEFDCLGKLLLPGRLRFDTVISGQALRATLSGCHYYRFFTP